MGNKKNVVLADFDCDEKWNFFKGVNQDSSWEIIKKVTNGSQRGKFASIKRYLKYFNFSFKIFIHRKRYHNIVAWQQFYGIILCYLLHFFHSKADLNIYIANFIYKSKSGFFGRIYKHFMRKALKCRQLKKVCVLSTFEVDYYSELFNLDKSKIFLSRQGIDKVKEFDIKDKGYFISVGRSNRDYDFLIDGFSKMPEYKLMIISDTYNNSKCPSNVIINNNCFGSESDKLIAECRSVILSLSDEPLSAGHFVVNTAFIYKKPVIVTRNPGIIEYVIDGKNAIIIDKKFEDLKKAIATILDDKAYKEMSEFCKPSSTYEYGKSFYDAIKEENDNV